MSTSFAASLGIYSSLSGLVWVGIGAYLADTVGRKRLLLISSIWVAVFPFVHFQILNTTNPSFIIAASCLGIGNLGGAALAAFFSEQFPAKYRYSGASLSYQLASPFAGGLAPIIGAAIVAAYGLSPGWILVAAMISIYALIGMVATLKTRDTTRGVLTEAGVEQPGPATQTV
jgi:MFS family permease